MKTTSKKDLKSANFEYDWKYADSDGFLFPN